MMRSSGERRQLVRWVDQVREQVEIPVVDYERLGSMKSVTRHPLDSQTTVDGKMRTLTSYLGH